MYATPKARYISWVPAIVQRGASADRLRPIGLNRVGVFGKFRFERAAASEGGTDAGTTSGPPSVLQPNDSPTLQLHSSDA